MIHYVLTKHRKYTDQLKNRWNENRTRIVDSKARSKDTMNTNLQTTKTQEDTSSISSISLGGPLAMKMNMISIHFGDTEGIQNCAKFDLFGSGDRLGARFKSDAPRIPRV
jgi:hypothetical protein